MLYTRSDYSWWSLPQSKVHWVLTRGINRLPHTSPLIVIVLHISKHHLLLLYFLNFYFLVFILWFLFCLICFIFFILEWNNFIFYFTKHTEYFGAISFRIKTILITYLVITVYKLHDSESNLVIFKIFTIFKQYQLFPSRCTLFQLKWDLAKDFHLFF